MEKDPNSAIAFDDNITNDTLGFPIRELWLDEPYCEQTFIYERITERIENMRARMLSAAAMTNTVIDDSTARGWAPSAEQYQALRAEFYQEQRRMRMIAGMQDYVGDINFLHASGIRNHQIVALRKIDHFMRFLPRTDELGGKSGYLDMPTGTGKTAILINAIRALKLHEDRNDPIRVAYLVPTKSILRQTIGDKDRGFARFAPEIDVGCYYQHDKELDREVVVMVKASFNNLVESGQIGEFDVIIDDESHMSLGEKTSAAVKEYLQGRLAIGCSATPDYDPAKRTDQLYAHLIHQLPFLDAIGDGLLAEVTGYEEYIGVDIDEGSLPEDPKERSTAIRLAVFYARLKYFTPKIMECVLTGGRFLIHCPDGGDIEFARQAADKLRNIIIEAAAPGRPPRYMRVTEVGGQQQSDAKQEFLIDQFNAGRIHGLTFVDAIGVGTDLPGATHLFDLAPGTSAVEKRQLFGRVLRLIFNKEGNPIPSHIYSCHEPSLGDEQYTCLDALQSKNRKRVRHRKQTSHDPFNRPDSIIDMQLIAPADTFGTEEETMGTLELTHKEGIEIIPAPEAAQLRDPEARTFQEACEWLGVSEPTLKKLLQMSGVERHKITIGDLVMIEAQRPELQVKPLPHEGYILVEDAMELLGVSGKPRKFIGDLRRRGIKLERFRHNGRVGEYLPTSIINDNG